MTCFESSRIYPCTGLAVATCVRRDLVAVRERRFTKPMQPKAYTRLTCCLKWRSTEWTSRIDASLSWKLS